MVVVSAGLLLHRPHDDVGVQLLLGHLGGPFWARKDDGAWSIPKGELEAGEDPLPGAVREFTEELGFPPPTGPAVDLGSVTAGGKTITVFAVRGDADPDAISPGTFTLQWPPRSGRMQSFPEIDRAGWFDPAQARRKLTTNQVCFVDRLLDHLGPGHTGE